MLREANARISSFLRNIFDVYSLSQLIREPTRVTSVSNILIDLYITNSPEEVTKSGVIHLAISDHSIVFFLHVGPTTIVMIIARSRHGKLSTLTVTSFYVISTKRNGPTSICILGQRTCGKNHGKNCFSVVLTNMHHSN